MHKLALNVCFFGKPDMLAVMDAVIGKDLHYEACKTLSTVHSYRLAAICAENKIDAIIAYSFGDGIAQELDSVKSNLPPIIFVRGKTADAVPVREAAVVDTTFAHNTYEVRKLLFKLAKPAEYENYFVRKTPLFSVE